MPGIRTRPGEAAPVPGFAPRFPWLSADLQTIRNMLVAEWLGKGVDLPPSEQVMLPVQDGTGDVMVAELNRCPTEGGAGLAVLVHGLTGCSRSTHMLDLTAALLPAGYDVLRLNLRGAGTSVSSCKDTYHAGRSGDLDLALDAFRTARPELSDRPLFFVGVSLGGNVLIKFLAEQGRRLAVRAAATVCAPLDLAETSQWFSRRRNMVYHRWLLARMKEGAAALPLSEEERAALRSVRTVYQFDDRFVAPRFGFRDAPDYYQSVSGGSFLPNVDVPTVLIHAGDDPWVPAATYRRVDWGGNTALHPVVPNRGGHVGFHTRGSRTPWYASRIVDFFQSVHGAF